MTTNKFQATGTVRAIMDTQQISDSFRKREFALEIQDGNYPQTVKFQTVQDRTELLDNLEIGQEVTVHFNLKGREFTRKTDGSVDYWTNLEAWRIEAPSDSAQPGTQSGTQPATSHSTDTGGHRFRDEDIPPPDDVPF